MKKRLMISLLIIFIVGIIGSAYNPVFGQAKKKIDPRVVILMKPMKVTGYMLLVNKFGSAWYNNRLYLHDDSNNPIQRIPCTFENRVMVENTAGLYSIDINPATPLKGTLNVDINNPKSPNNDRRYFPVKASYLIGDLIRVTSPSAGARIPLATTPFLIVSWRGGTLASRYIVGIWELKGDSRGVKVYDERNVAVTRLTIPTRIFRAGVKYELCIQNTSGNFTISGRVLPGSVIQFQQSISTSFLME